jgi:DhnA family fructose-bisphosphate aldolase class Ia
VICSLFLENENVLISAEVVRQKEKLGIPLIGECYVVEHQDLTSTEVKNKVKRATRVMTELGADLIKCFLAEDFQEVVDNLPVPALHPPRRWRRCGAAR